mgnify:CR=1 FL=1
MKKKTPFISKLYVALIFVFLYAPILVMMLFSLNSTSSTYIFSGFSTHWYNEMFKDTVAVQALKNTVLLAVCTALVSTVLGVLAAVVSKSHADISRFSVFVILPMTFLCNTVFSTQKLPTVFYCV